MLTQEEREFGFTEEDFEYSIDTFQESLKTNALYRQFIKPEVIDSQVSWTKWHIMDRKGVDYHVAVNILERAVESGLLKSEDYYGRFVVIK